MPVENERNFLVEGDGWKKAVTGSEEITQGYLGGERCSVRIRLTGTAANINIKSLRIGPSRAEYEYPIPVDEAREMLHVLTVGALIEKTRYRVAHGGLEWEVDVFHGENEGLVVAEVELDDPGQDFSTPEWAGREVTGEARYYNVELSRHPYRKWRGDE